MVNLDCDRSLMRNAYMTYSERFLNRYDDSPLPTKEIYCDVCHGTLSGLRDDVSDGVSTLELTHDSF